MDSVGQLAGGVAHDFNNILTIIQGHAEMLRSSQTLERKQSESVLQIAQASERAANLTRQLLTFSRQQLMQPKSQDLNAIVTQMTTMLQRILGEDIVLQVHYASHPPPVIADRGMLEQVLLNLAVNSRDAMPKGGQLMIRTTVTYIDEAYARQNPDAMPGPCVCLAVTDTGCGIAPENLPHIFEPFFTTKEVGRGTGLGLATVYGIVKQHKGWIHVASAPGKGTTFQIFLPASTQRPDTHGETTAASEIRGGTETIMLVEDEAPLRHLALLFLKMHGYRVFEAGSGVAALQFWQQNQETVDLLVTDVVMPGGVSGLELAEKLQVEDPHLKVIYTSGYSREIVKGDSVLRDGKSYFLQKPYHPRKLVQAVRDCLDGMPAPD
jgi:CheY-like chemotaxis protein